MKTAAIAVLVALGLAAPAMADDGFRVAFGAANANPNDDSSYLNNVEAAAGLAANSTKVTVEDNTQLGITLNYDFHPNWSLELLAATPFSHDIKVKGGAVDGLKVGKTKHLPPTLSVQYRFNPGQDFRPYVGLGLNYTTFFDEKVDGELAGTLDALGLTGSKELELDDSFGLAAQVGFDWNINDKVYVRGAIWYADIDTDAKVKVNGATVQKVSVDIDPTIYMLGLGYRF
ncbi:OmpW family outer membrane protein [Gallaecimonas sp. GXIMD4217]|uniref:OmpW/AlkL family protein n=1 Tax=Gallaecimonas sp. GXIMD4217 TaxID=3131927 RepID=UPI00311B11C9